VRAGSACQAILDAIARDLRFHLQEGRVAACNPELARAALPAGTGTPRSTLSRGTC